MLVALAPLLMFLLQITVGVKKMINHRKTQLIVRTQRHRIAYAPNKVSGTTKLLLQAIVACPLLSLNTGFVLDCEYMHTIFYLLSPFLNILHH